MIICWVYHYKELILRTGSHVSHWWSQNTDKKNATYLPEYTKQRGNESSFNNINGQ